jgi:RNA polymerase sigma factor (sigma-70 family)
MASRLEDISTVCEIRADAGKPPDPAVVAGQLVTRYQKAVRKYLSAILRRPVTDCADEAYNDLYLAVLEDGLDDWDGKERFRDFLKKAVRRAARAYQGRRPSQLDEKVDVPEASDDVVWVRAWRDMLLRKALDDLDAFEQRERAAGRAVNYATVVRLVERYPDEKGEWLAARLSISHAKFRKDLSLARRKLVEFLRAEVRRTEPRWTDADIDDELRRLGLGHVLQAFGQEKEV